jgi:hypothetical protein
MLEALTEILLAKAAKDYLKTKQLYKEAAASISRLQLEVAGFPDTLERSAVNFQLQRAYDPAYADSQIL